MASKHYKSAIGDPGMRRDGLRVAIEAWNQCNEVGEEAPNMGSPRLADCFDVDHSKRPVRLIHKVDEQDNRLGVLSGPYGGITTKKPDTYAAEKELYLGHKCQVLQNNTKPWQFWMIMLKSGNMDTAAAKCPENGHRSKPFPPEARFPCFGKGCMNMPYIFHDYTSLQLNRKTLKGSFYGTWDLDSDVRTAAVANGTSYFKVTWVKRHLNNGSWVFHHKLKTSPKYPWLMLYLRIHRTDRYNFPYDAYHLWCAPGNAKYLEEPHNLCDPYSNPQAQEILQILPHPVWGEYGYPTKKGEGWIGDPRTWHLDVGDYLRTFIFIRIPALSLLLGTGHQLTWELKSTLAKMKWQNGVDGHCQNLANGMSMILLQLEGFTVIFNKAKDEKAGGKPESPGKVDPHIKPGGDP
ncbi:hypothetical protein GH714_026603 [Hevea brasiliensis]|uniref:DUF7705 domain-containing protein n=1 Tax=Hevea brasiliensis TaxID=3981 RepID=A0A6A6MMG9_HEVBR|nr:hypothetical protein GH714_026603 [Hevea brasiliensis]